MSRGQQDLPPNASAVIASRLIDTIVEMLPSQREKRGDHKLDEARALAQEFESVILQRDRDIIEQKILHAREVKEGLDSKSGIPRFLQAKKYGKTARDAYRYAKTVSDRGKDELFFARQPGTPPVPMNENTFDRVLKVARPLYRCYLSCKGAFPSSFQKEEWMADVWSDACERTGGYSGLLPAPEWLVVGSMTLVAAMKTKIVHSVESLYGFNTSRAPESISKNAGLAQGLLTDMTFIYREFKIGGTRQHPYRHPIIQKAINLMWFQSKDGDGIVFYDLFMPIPIQAIALALTVIECCIGEWTDGTYKTSNWNEDHYKAAYLSHIMSLTDLCDHEPPQGQGLFAHIQYELLKEARIHAGAPSDPVTGLGRLQPDALLAAVLEDLPEYPGLDIPTINVSDES